MGPTSVGGMGATATSATAENLPIALESEAGPSKTTAPAKRKYEVNQADLDFCKKVRHLKDLRGDCFADPQQASLRSNRIEG